MAALSAFLAAVQALAPVIALLLIKLWGDRQQAIGAEIEAGKVSQATAPTETAIAQAETDAPATQEAVVDRLKKGTF